jgi:hypothetical protein
MTSKTDPEYYGKILTGSYSPKIKKRVSQCLTLYRRFETTNNPTMAYLAAWHEGDRVIWYEFTSRRLRELLGCAASEVADIFRQAVLEQRIYSYQDQESGVKKDIIDQKELIRNRKQLRQKVTISGVIEAIYKIGLPNGRHVWLKDQAKVEMYPEDRTCLSNGCLTLISKEMEAEEEREKLYNELQEVLSNVKQLSGLLPICASCKKIRDDQGYWNQIEEYIRKHTEAVFTHGLCPPCAEKLYPEFYKKDG